MENNWWDLNTQNMHASLTFNQKNMNIQYPCSIIQRYPIHTNKKYGLFQASIQAVFCSVNSTNVLITNVVTIQLGKWLKVRMCGNAEIYRDRERQTEIDRDKQK